MSYLHGDPDIGPLECRRVVDPITRHARLVPTLTQRLHLQRPTHTQDGESIEPVCLQATLFLCLSAV